MGTKTFAVVALGAGTLLYYTGRAGEGWLSPNAAEAFTYSTLEAAARRAVNFAVSGTMLGLAIRAKAL